MILSSLSETPQLGIRFVELKNCLSLVTHKNTYWDVSYNVSQVTSDIIFFLFGGGGALNASSVKLWD